MRTEVKIGLAALAIVVAGVVITFFSRPGPEAVKGAGQPAAGAQPAKPPTGPPSAATPRPGESGRPTAARPPSGGSPSSSGDARNGARPGVTPAGATTSPPPSAPTPGPTLPPIARPEHTAGGSAPDRPNGDDAGTTPGPRPAVATTQPTAAHPPGASAADTRPGPTPGAGRPEPTGPPEPTVRPVPRNEQTPKPPSSSDLGGLRSPEPAPPRLAPPSPAAGPEARTATYVVKQGEYLSTIAEEVYGSQKFWTRIRDANPGIDPDRIRVGQVLKLPPKEDAAAGAGAAKPATPAGAEPAKPPAAAPPSAATPRGGAKYVVRDGDYLSTIAADAYGDAKYWTRIRDANPGIDPEHILVGQALTLPPKEEVVKPSSRSGEGSKPRGEESKPTNGAAKPEPARAAGGASPSPGAAGVSKSTYRVGRGDTLVKIARKVLKNEDRWREIYELNRSKISDPDRLLEGTELTLPALESEKTPSGRANTNGRPRASRGAPARAASAARG